MQARCWSLHTLQLSDVAASAAVIAAPIPASISVAAMRICFRLAA
jgi:hypothetical protein